MILIAVLIALVLDRMLFWHRDSGFDRFYGRAIDALATRLPEQWEGVGGILIVVLPPVVVVGLVQWLIADWLFGLASLVFAIAVLLLTLGPVDVVTAVDDYIEARRTDDTERSDFYYERLVGEQPPSDRGPEEARRIAAAVVYQGHDHLFATLFWFCVLGPLGAVLYRMAAEAALKPSPLLVARPALGRAGRHVLGVLGWIPTRLLAFAYALTGSFEAALRRFRAGAAASAADVLEANQDFLAGTGAAALRSAETADEAGTGSERRSSDAAAAAEAARALVMRAGIFWIAVLALLTLAGWFG